MIRFSELPDTAQGFLFIWLMLVFIICVYDFAYFIWLKQTGYIILSAVSLAASYFLLQLMIADGKGGENGIRVRSYFEDLYIVWWISAIAVIMFSGLVMVYILYRWEHSHITPKSVKESIDKLQAGLCYWEDGGRIILSNRKMDGICMALSGNALLNCEDFLKYIESDCVLMPDGTRRFFLRDRVEFEGRLINELVAVDVTELYRKTELLQQETTALRRMNESLKNYNRSMEETVRQQEILDAQVYIHDEMNRLMLLTVANADMSMKENDFEEIMTLWKNNAKLLAGNSGREDVKTDITEIEHLAEMLNLRLCWKEDEVRVIPDRFREVFMVVVKEAIANAVKHANATEISVSVCDSGERIKIDISNDGILPENGITYGGGLSNIKTLVEEQGGRFDVECREHFVMLLDLPSENTSPAE